MSGDLLLRGGRVVVVPGRAPEQVDLRLRAGRVQDVGARLPPGGAQVVNVAGHLLTPGLLDCQVNGISGVDLTSEPDRLSAVAAALPRHGVTSFLPTLVSCAAEHRRAALRTWSTSGPGTAEATVGARPLGWHFEGPMLAPAARGAHEERWLRRPEPSLADGWAPAAGVLLVTLAPELPGVLEVVRLLAARGVVVSLGHTRASLADVEAAVAAGATAVTHLFNAMPPLGHRTPGPVGAALGGSELTAGVIVDGWHVDPLVVRTAWRALGPRRFLTVSDTTAALDLPPGPVTLGGRQLVVGADGAVRVLTDPETIAGGSSGLASCLRRLAAVTEQPLTAVLPAATSVPARLLGQTDLGHLRPGARGDVVAWDTAEQVILTVVAGHVAWRAPGRPEEPATRRGGAGAAQDAPHGRRAASS